MIEGVLIEERKIFPNEKGNVLHMLRSDAPFFKKFGEIYFSVCLPGAVKGWKKHLRQTQHFAVPFGELKLVLFDDRPDSSTREQVQEIHIGENQYRLVRIPYGVWYSFSAVGKEKALIANCTDMPHESEESISRKLDDKTMPAVWEEQKA